jgi:hypothetical protein
MMKALKYLGTAMGLLILVCLGLWGWYIHDCQYMAVERQPAAEEVVVQALLAVKHQDKGKILSLLHHDSLDARMLRKYPHSQPKIIGRLSRLHGLDNMSEAAIRHAVRTVHRVRIRLVASILEKFIIGWHCSEAAWQQCNPVVVGYTLNGTPMISVVLLEKGEWQLSDLPMTYSAKMLRYKTITQANLHGDALPPEP